MKTGIPSKNLSIPSFTDLAIAVFSTSPTAVVAKDLIGEKLLDNAVIVSSNGQDQNTGQK